MIGQIQVCRLKIDAQQARNAILANKAKLIDMANSVDPILVKFGGGCRDVEARVLETDSGLMTRKSSTLAEGTRFNGSNNYTQNAINTVAELLGQQSFRRPSSRSAPSMAAKKSK